MSEPQVSAAGGVVVRDGGDGSPQVAVVHRPRYDDWSLAEGQARAGGGVERRAPCARSRRRPGSAASSVEELEPARYRDRKGREKLVRWWLMRPLGGEFVAGDEVDELRWLELGEALEAARLRA